MAEESRTYPIAWYAPGNYQCECVTCRQYFQGDKRAMQCEPCAMKTADSFGAKPKAEIKVDEQITVQALIDALMKVEDKTLPILSTVHIMNPEATVMYLCKLDTANPVNAGFKVVNGNPIIKIKPVGYVLNMGLFHNGEPVEYPMARYSKTAPPIFPEDRKETNA